jgi:diguanylate cyclase (GGDEF)-like protein/putative nucleotidyltransferase with HDIG domain
MGQVRARRKQEALELELRDARKRIAALELRAKRDEATGLPILSVFMQRLETEVERSRRHGAALSVAVVDLDGFQAINSAHGRPFGDRVLALTAKTLSGWVRTTDLVCRAAGDEFVLVLPETDGRGASRALARLLLDLEALALGPVESLSASIGVAQWRRPENAEQLLARAADATRTARARGGGRVHLDDPLVSPDAAPLGDAIGALAEALVERDRYTGEHSESVVELACEVGRGLGLGSAELQHIRAAALLHDIGKVAIPDHILNKPAGLSEAEWTIMREHPVIGERILRSIPGMGLVARIVRHEHESFDGSGYPDGLSGDRIPIGSRIILACDAYHAMTSDRPYRSAMEHGDALRELAAGAGKQFDPQVTEALIGALYLGRMLGPAVPLDTSAAA